MKENAVHYSSGETDKIPRIKSPILGQNPLTTMDNLKVHETRCRVKYSIITTRQCERLCIPIRTLCNICSAAEMQHH